MKYSLLFVFLAGSCYTAAAQYPGPIMDSIKKYQKLIQTAPSQAKKMEYAMRLQKIITGVQSLDPAVINGAPKTKEEALKLRDKQVAEVKATQKSVDTSRKRADKYAGLQKLQGQSDSVQRIFSHVGDKGILQKGLITLPGVEEGIRAAQSGMDTAAATVSFSYRISRLGKGGTVTGTATASTQRATVYRQSGIITVLAASNGNSVDDAGLKGMPVPAMESHLTGSARYSAAGNGCTSAGSSTGAYGFAFYYNPLTNVYSAGCSAGLITKTDCSDPEDHRTEPMGLSLSATNDLQQWKLPKLSVAQKQTADKVATFSKTENGFTVSYGYSKDGVNESFQATVILSPGRYDAFIEPANEADYNKWLPRGPDLTNYPFVKNGGKGADIQLKISLWDNKEKKMSAENYVATVRLNNVSQLPGYCMNFPEGDAEADNRPDLRFERADSGLYRSWNEKELKTQTVSGSQFITVASFDYAASGDVTATLTLDDGTEVLAHPHSGAVFPLPRRSDNSLIADAWKEEQGVAGKDDKADDEKLVSDDKYPGDGLTLFEEYRGFLEKRKHFRGDAEKKDVMLCDKIATTRSADGIRFFANAFLPYGNKVAVHARFKDDEFGKKQDNGYDERQEMAKYGVETPIEYDRCINYNYDKDLHLVDQHGVTIMFAGKELGYAKAISRIDEYTIGTPKTWFFLIISRDFSPDPDGWSTTYGDVDANGNIKTGEGKAKIITDEYAVTVAHELLHCFHVTHHGSAGALGKLRLYYFLKEKTWGVWWKNDAPVEPTTRVDLRWEDKPDYPIPAQDTALVYARRNWLVFGENSVQSGVEDCIMRYDNSHGFSPDGLQTVYLLKSPRYGELTGIALCHSAKGTGINAEEHKPMSRYGNAESGHGDCIHQFCVSDQYE